MCVCIRWDQTAKHLQLTYDNLMGDVVISSGVMAYLGAFTSAYRSDCIRDWVRVCKVRQKHRHVISLMLLGNSFEMYFFQ